MEKNKTTRKRFTVLKKMIVAEKEMVMSAKEKMWMVAEEAETMKAAVRLSHL